MDGAGVQGFSRFVWEDLLKHNTQGAVLTSRRPSFFLYMFKVQDQFVIKKIPSEYLNSADFVSRGVSIPISGIHHAAILQKFIKGILYVVHIKLSIATTIQFQIHSRCQETKSKMNLRLNHCRFIWLCVLHTWFLWWFFFGNIATCWINYLLVKVDTNELCF